MPSRSTKPVVTTARYAKKMMAVHCPPDGSGFKTRAMRLAETLRGRYSRREDAYIMSVKKAARLMQLYADGWDGNYSGTSLIPPKGERMLDFEPT